MAFNSILPYFLLMGIYLAIGYALSKKSKFYHKLLQSSSDSRYESIDGLRGFLALGVFFTHGLITYYYHLHGKWELPPSAFYSTLGEFSVALFFIISAFLFWGKVLQSEKPISAMRLYRSRNRRLTPMYVFSVLLVLLIVALRTDFKLQVGLGELAFQILSWFSYGFLTIPLMPDINGLKDTHTIESVYWTLTFEWEFYLLLPLFARLPARTITLAVLMSVTYFFGPPAIVTLNFAFGAIAAHMMHRYDLQKYLKGRQYDVLMVLILVLVFTLFPRGHGLMQYILAFVFFMLLVNRNDMFGLLTSSAAKFLGAISYSVYLLHNITLNQVFYSFDKYQPIETISTLTFWVLVGLSGILAILFSAVTFRVIEHRFYVRPRVVGEGQATPVPSSPKTGNEVTTGNLEKTENFPK